MECNFLKPYSGVLTCKFFFKVWLLHREPYNGVLNTYSSVIYGTRVPCNFFYFILSLIAPYSIFYKSSFTLKLDFEKIELQKRGISLISLRNETKRWNFCVKRAFTHFGQECWNKCEKKILYDCRNQYSF